MNLRTRMEIDIEVYRHGKEHGHKRWGAKKPLVFGGSEKDQFCVTLYTDFLNIISNTIWKLS